MVTKSKKFLYGNTLKGLAFTMVIVLVAVIFNINFKYIKEGNYSDLFSEKFEYTATYTNTIHNVIWRLDNITSDDGDRAHIDSEKWSVIDDYKFDLEIRKKFVDFKHKYEDDYKTDKELRVAFEEENEYYFQKAIDDYKYKELEGYERTMRQLNQIEGVEFYASGRKGTVYSKNYKGKDSIKLFDEFLILDREELVKSENMKGYNTSIEKLYIGIDKEFLKTEREVWENTVGGFKRDFDNTMKLLVPIIIMILFLLLTCGRNGEDDKVYLIFVDNLYNDIRVGVYGFAAAALVNCLAGLTINSVNNMGNQILVVSLISITLITMMSIVRQVKNKTVLKNTLIYVSIKFMLSIIKKIFDWIGKVFSNAPLGMRMIPSPKKIEDFRSILSGVKQIKAGDLNHVISVSENGVYSELAEDINNIAMGLKNAVENEVKSERLKTELITNVSHDIRTPLTSILNYVDLLGKDDELSEQNKEYLDILDKKSKRLKMLIDNLFEASKASSGDIPINLSRVNISNLMHQALGEMEEKISNSSLEFIIEEESDDIWVKCDGKHMWRIFENLINNILKYSMNSTRVYLDTREFEDFIEITFKNISNHKLNIDEEELMGRFVRGEESRSSEGSGLGLSISRSLCELQGGRLEIKIDGDLFKATLIMPISRVE